MLSNYIKRKTKHREVIGDLIVIEDNQEKTVTSNKDKAQALCDFFQVYFLRSFVMILLHYLLVHWLLIQIDLSFRLIQFCLNWLKLK